MRRLFHTTLTNIRTYLLVVGSLCALLLAPLGGAGLQELSPYISAQAWAESGAQIREKAFKHFSSGKNAYKRRQYQSAETSFNRSLNYIKDHQTYYYRALSISKQSRACDEVVQAWRDYFAFCKEKKSNCVQSWAQRARKRLASAERECQAQKREQAREASLSKTMYGTCPPGATLIGGECVISQVKCPRGSMLRGGRCTAQASCPHGMELQGDRCVSPVSCPPGTSRKGVRCVIQAECEEGLQYVEGRGCQLIVPSSRDENQNAPLRAAQPKGFFDHMPLWAYSALGLGVASHVINIFTSSPSVLDVTFYSTIAGYAFTGIGVGVATYHTLSEPEETARRVTITDTHHLFAHQRRDLERLPLMFNWSGTF